MGKSKYSDFGKKIGAADKEGNPTITKEDIKKSKGRKPIRSIQDIRDAFKRKYKK